MRERRITGLFGHDREPEAMRERKVRELLRASGRMFLGTVAERFAGPPITARVTHPADRADAPQRKAYRVIGDVTVGNSYPCIQDEHGGIVFGDATGGGGGGVTDHGALTGLTDDDHPQYHTDARGDARYSLLAHNHDAAYVNEADFFLATDSRSGTTAPSGYPSGLSLMRVTTATTGWPTANGFIITNRKNDDAEMVQEAARTNSNRFYRRRWDATGSAWAAWDEWGDANSRTPTARLGTGTAAATNYLAGDQSWKTPLASEITNTPAGGIAAATVQAAINELDTEKLATTHTSDADPHTQYQKEDEKASASGYASLDANTRVPNAQLGTGTADSSTFLRGDRVWAAPAGGSGFYDTVAEDGTARTQRPTLNFGTGLDAADNAGATRTDVTLDPAELLATASAHGFMSSTYASKVNGIEAGAVVSSARTYRTTMADAQKTLSTGWNTISELSTTIPAPGAPPTGYVWAIDIAGQVAAQPPLAQGISMVRCLIGGAAIPNMGAQQGTAYINTYLWASIPINGIGGTITTPTSDTTITVELNLGENQSGSWHFAASTNLYVRVYLKKT